MSLSHAFRLTILLLLKILWPMMMDLSITSISWMMGIGLMWRKWYVHLVSVPSDIFCELGFYYLCVLLRMECCVRSALSFQH